MITDVALLISHQIHLFELFDQLSLILLNFSHPHITDQIYHKILHFTRFETTIQIALIISLPMIVESLLISKIMILAFLFCTDEEINEIVIWLVVEAGMREDKKGKLEKQEKTLEFYE